MAETLTQPEQEVSEVTEITEAGTLEGNGGVIKPSRDEDLYLDDGDVVLLVEDRLFKVHKFLFVRDSELFQTLFTLPQSKDLDEVGLEGQSDKNPIICAGDSAEDFRALCWCLYSRPPDILAQQTWDTADIPKVARVLAMSHKYDFTVFRDWALDVLDTLSSTPLGNRSLFGKLGTWTEVGRVLNLASQCGKSTLVQRMEEDWLRHISLPPNQLHAFKYALNAAKGSNTLRQFHGKVYYAYLQTTGIFDLQAQDGFGTSNIVDTSSDLDKSLSKLGSQTRECIYRGYWSLSQLRRKLSQPPKLDVTCSGNHTQICTLLWCAWWKETLEQAMREGRQLNDPGRLIQEIQAKATNPIQYRGVTIPCSTQIIGQVRLMKENFDNSLADRFLGPQ